MKRNREVAQSLFLVIDGEESCDCPKGKETEAILLIGFWQKLTGKELLRRARDRPVQHLKF